jgi:3-oxoacyl-[acyl-carrier-protein] synthase-3
MSCISYCDYYKPRQSLPALEILKRLEVAPQQQEYLINQGELREIAVETELSPHEMLEKLIDKYRQTYPVADVDYLIFTALDPLLSSGTGVPYYLARKYAMSQASVITVNQGCAGTLYAVHLADSLIRHHPGVKVLIASVSKLATLKERYLEATILGDGAGILVVEESGPLRIVDSMMKSDGTNSYETYLCAGREFRLDQMQREKEFVINLDWILNGIIGRNGLQADDIRIFVPQSINLRAFEMVFKMIRLNPAKFFFRNIPDGGHLGDVDLIRNLTDVLACCPVQPGDKLLTFSMGEVAGNLNYISGLLEVGGRWVF